MLSSFSLPPPLHVQVILKDKCHKEGEMEKVQDEIDIMRKVCFRTRQEYKKERARKHALCCLHLCTRSRAGMQTRPD